MRFIKTFIIIVVVIIIYSFSVLKMHGLKTFASSIMPVKLSVKNLTFSLQFSISAYRYLQLEVARRIIVTPDVDAISSRSLIIVFECTGLGGSWYGC